MRHWFLLIGPVLVAYLLGSIPFAYIIAKAYGKDLHRIGSGNIGATNLARALGRRWGIVCFLLDMLKGLLPMLCAGFILKRHILQIGMTDGQFLWYWLIIGFACVAGHLWPVYLGFKGGKGVATSFGVALGLWPYMTICAIGALAIWLIVVMIWRYVSLASISSAISLPILLSVAITLRQDWSMAVLWPLVLVAVSIATLVVLMHKANIRRLLAGTEPRIRTTCTSN